MARSKITSASKDLIKDNGAVLISIIQEEQIHLELTLNWLVNLAGYTVTAIVQEGLNDGKGSYPSAVQSNGIIDELPLLDPITTNNKITLVLPKSLSLNWTIQPTPENPVYGFIEVSIKDSGNNAAQQIWKPFRGLVEVKYSPTKGF
jgi:hypothetical protein